MKKFENFTAFLKVLQTAPEQDMNNEFIISGITEDTCGIYSCFC